MRLLNQTQALAEWDSLGPKVRKMYEVEQMRWGLKEDPQVMTNWVMHGLLQFRTSATLSDNAQESGALLILDDAVIPLMVLNTTDMGLIHTLWGDYQVPYLVDYMCRTIFEGRHAGLFVYQPQSDYIVEMPYPDFETHLKNLSQVGRAWKKNEADELLTFTRVGVDHKPSPEVMQSNTQYWLDQDEATKRPVTLLEAKYLSAAHAYPLGESYSICYRDREIAYAKIDFDDELGEVYWINTFMIRDESSQERRLGNWIMLKLLQRAYEMYGTRGKFNLGLDIFDYKLAWKPIKQKRVLPHLNMDLVSYE